MNKQLNFLTTLLYSFLICLPLKICGMELIPLQSLQGKALKILSQECQEKRSDITSLLAKLPDKFHFPLQLLIATKKDDDLDENVVWHIINNVPIFSNDVVTMVLENGNVEQINVILTFFSKEFLNAKDKSDNFPLFSAIKLDNIEKVKLLVNYIPGCWDINQKDQQGRSILACTDNLALKTLLLEVIMQMPSMQFDDIYSVLTFIQQQCPSALQDAHLNLQRV